MDGSLGIVFVRHRVAEIDEETVTEILGDVALEAADDFAAHRLIGTDHSAQFLRIEIPGKGGRPDEVAEHDCQLPAFSIRNRTLGYRGGGGSFVWAAPPPPQTVPPPP